MQDYCGTLPEVPSVEELEDAVTLASYCSNAVQVGAFSESGNTVGEWLNKIDAAVSSELQKDLGRLR